MFIPFTFQTALSKSLFCALTLYNRRGGGNSSVFCKVFSMRSSSKWGPAAAEQEGATSLLDLAFSSEFGGGWSGALRRPSGAARLGRSGSRLQTQPAVVRRALAGD